MARCSRKFWKLHVTGQTREWGTITPPALLGSLLFESEQTTGDFLSRANDFGTCRTGMPVADLALFVVCGKAGDEIYELSDNGRIFADDLLGELVPLGDD